MRNTILALVFSLSLTSCASNDVGGNSSDIGGALVIAVVLGAAVAVAAH